MGPRRQPQARRCQGFTSKEHIYDNHSSAKKYVSISFLLAQMSEHLCSLSTVMHCLLMTRMISGPELIMSQIKSWPICSALQIVPLIIISGKLNDDAPREQFWRQSESQKPGVHCSCHLTFSTQYLFAKRGFTVSQYNCQSAQIRMTGKTQHICRWWPSSSRRDTDVVSSVECPWCGVRGEALKVTIIGVRGGLTLVWCPC